MAKLLHPDDDAALSECEKTVLEGRFACPYHRCAVCKKLEIKADPDLQFAVCRRCPKSYHRNCLPRCSTIYFFFNNFEQFLVYLCSMSRNIVIRLQNMRFVLEMPSTFYWISLSHLFFLYIFLSPKGAYQIFLIFVKVEI